MSVIIMDNKDKGYTHITLDERGKIEAYLEDGKSLREIARRLGRSVSTISEEVKRGTVHQIKNDKDVYVYYADTAQLKYERKRLNSVSLPFDELYSAQFFEELAVALIKPRLREYSVDTFVAYYKKEHPEERVPSTSVVYRLIDEGKLAVKSIHLPKKSSRKPRKDKASIAKGSNKKVLGTSISERPENVNEREEFGHYEADLVIGKKTTGEAAVLTLVERQTRHAFVRKVYSKEAEAVHDVLEGLIAEVGVSNFKSITFDNGSEFSTMSKLEGVDVYYAHAYSSWERGSNENFNGLLREFMPKGGSFNGYSDADIAIYQDCINNRLRKILDYQCATEMYEQATVA